MLNTYTEVCTTQQRENYSGVDLLPIVFVGGDVYPLVIAKLHMNNHVRVTHSYLSRTLLIPYYTREQCGRERLEKQMKSNIEYYSIVILSSRELLLLIKSTEYGRGCGRRHAEVEKYY